MMSLAEHIAVIEVRSLIFNISSGTNVKFPENLQPYPIYRNYIHYINYDSLVNVIGEVVDYGTGIWRLESNRTQTKRTKLEPTFWVEPNQTRTGQLAIRRLRTRTEPNP